MESKGTTTFSRLPITIKLDIIQMLKWRDKLNSRLVSREWCILVGDKFNPTYSISDGNKSLSTLQESSFYKIRSLKVKNLSTNILPISSSTSAGGIPTAEIVVLQSGISRENIMKLLQSYSASCLTLNLGFSCLASLLKPTDKKFSIGFIFSNIKTVSVQIRYYNSVLTHHESRNTNEQHQHLLALVGLLKYSSFPRLKDFNIYIEAHPQLENIQMGTIYQKLVDSFGIFLEKHGSNITSFAMSSHDLFCCPIFVHFVKLVNVEHLKISLQYLSQILQPNIGEGMNLTDKILDNCPIIINYGFNLKLDAFLLIDLNLAVNGFHKLKSLNLLTHGILDHANPFRLEVHSDLPQTLLANNKQTLLNLTKIYISPEAQCPFEWLHQNHCPNLQVLDIITNFYEHQFSPAIMLNYKLNSLIKLDVGILQNSPLPEAIDWRNELCEWIVQIGPNLKILTLKFNPQIELRLVDVQILLNGLKKLKKVLLLSKWLRQIDIEGQNWLNGLSVANNNNIEFIQQNYASSVIKIKRPISIV